jgi:hypothetical protein
MLDISNSLLSCFLCLFVCGGLCRSVAEPQRDLGAQASPSRTRSPDPKVVAQSLVDDARTANPPPAADEKGGDSAAVYKLKDGNFAAC